MSNPQTDQPGYTTYGEENTATANKPLNTAPWTESLPQLFGIRDIVQASKFRWCFREAGLWGVATGTAMTLHRFRMKSSYNWAINAGFGSLLTVFLGSYYFCTKRREHQEKMIDIMMKVNQFQHASDMPEPKPIDENHPFIATIENVNDGDDIVYANEKIQYVAELPERKEWQKRLPPQDPSQVFKPVVPSDKPR